MCLCVCMRRHKTNMYTHFPPMTISIYRYILWVHNYSQISPFNFSSIEQNHFLFKSLMYCPLLIFLLMNDKRPKYQDSLPDFQTLNQCNILVKTYSTCVELFFFVVSMQVPCKKKKPCTFYIVINILSAGVVS